ncbi:MAG: ParB/RepB/Spo0J family partition protein [Oscillospiraceae bacterium]|nr:ParB/RepB/Spo0J family partition protein [Oscillospiraceae bacterium]
MANRKSKSAVNIPLEKIRPFEGHPYKVIDNEEMNNLIESIQEQGILSPLIVRPLENTEDEYELISGHRRLRAAQKAGAKNVPVFIYAVSRDEAAIMLVDSNLHREHILPSEKAFAYKLKLEALKHQGKTSCQLGTKLRTDEEIAEDTNDSARQVQRYIRLTYLIPELLDLVDEGRIALTPAVELSYLTEEQQYSLLGTIEVEDRTPSLSQAVRFKKLSQAGQLTDELIDSIMQEEKANQREMFRIPMERLLKAVPDLKPSQVEDFIIKAIVYYQKHLNRGKDKGAR